MNDQRRRKIEDTWAEASLELLMDDYAEQSGEVLWQEFQRDAECAMPENLDEACQDLIHTSFSKSIQKNRVKNISTRLKQLAPQACKAAMIAFAMVGAMATLTLSVEAIRVPVLNFFLTQEERYTIISSGALQETPPETYNFSEIKNILPSDYDIIYEQIHSNGLYVLRCEDQQGNRITVHVGNRNSQLYIDTEDASQECVEINGFPALLVKKDGLHIIIDHLNAALRIDFYAQSLEESIFWEIALQLTYL